MALQHLRSSTANKRPIPSVMSAGQLAVNTNEASPGLFFKDSNGDLVKVGPVHIGANAPNSSPDSVAATALVTGTVYQILVVGTSDFTLVGASANTVGVVFTATGTTTGTGTVSGQQGNEKGEMWLDSTGGSYVFKIYDGTAWRSEVGEFVNATGDTMTGDLLFNNANIVFEGSAADDHETTLTVVNPTADRTITLPNVTGTVVTTGDTGSVTSTMLADGTIVNADINASAEIAVSKLANGTARQLLQTDAAGTGVEFTSNVDVPGTLDVTGVAVFDSNVGIGTSSPSQLLEVSGSALSTTFQGEVLAAGTTERLRLGYRTGGPNTGLTCGQIVEDTNTLHIAGRDTANGDIIFHSGSGIPEVMRIDASNGNVGIGTSSPQAKLDVRGVSDTPSLTFNSSGQAIVGDSASQLAIGRNSSTPFSLYLQGRASNNNARNISLAPVGGNVGIGTTSPDAKLHVYSTAINQSWSDSTADLVKLEGAVEGINLVTSSTGFISFSDADARARGVIEYLHSSDSMQFDTAGSEKMRIDSSGNVGIGTSSPGELLTLSSGNNTSFGIKLQTGTQAAHIKQDTAGNLEINNNLARSLIFSTSNAERARIDSSGNVGIGTASPDEALHISDGGNSAIRLGVAGGNYAYRLRANVSSTVNGGFLIEDAVTSNDLYKVKSGGSGLHQFYVNNTEKMRLDNGGSLAIGTTAPTARLTQVGGRFHNNRPSNFWSSTDYIDIAGYGSLTTQGSFELDLQCNGYRNTSGTWTRLNTNGQVGAAKISLNPSGYMKFSTEANKANGSSSAITERVRIHSDGSFTLNNTSINPVASDVNGIALRTSGNFITCMRSVNAPHQFRRNNDGDIIRFYRNSTTDCGAIRVTSGATHYDESSDYRLKENIVPIVDGIDRVKQLQPKRFNFIEFPENTVDGFIAHEAQLAVPEAISGEKDGTEDQEYEVTPAVVDEEGNVTEAAIMDTRTVPKYQAIDKSKLVPLLTAALQEAIAKIETLEQRLLDAGIA